jgi:hypothetical protein
MKHTDIDRGTVDRIPVENNGGKEKSAKDNNVYLFYSV